MTYKEFCVFFFGFFFKYKQAENNYANHSEKLLSIILQFAFSV